MGIFDKLRSSKQPEPYGETPISPKRFQYHPLPPFGLRLITFTKRGIDLSTHQWFTAPTFHALSYVCGAPPDPPRHYIECRDVDRGNRGQLAISPNLYEALPYLRDISKTPIWIDAICIDQHTVEEKEKAVARMDDIYKLASTVLIWLGPPDPLNELAIFFLRATCDPNAFSISSNVCETIYRPAIEATRQVLAAGCPIDVSPEGFAERGLPKFGHPVWNAIIDLMTRPWTTRVWTFQEAKLAQRATVMCGPVTIPWNYFLPITTAMIRTQILYQTISRLPPNLIAFDLPDHTSAKMFLTYLSNCRTRSCYLKEDRVYALLSLADKSLRDEIPVKYSTDPNHYQQVYLSVARALLKQNLFYMILALAPSHNKPEGIPSWCPDWSLPGISAPVYPEFSAGLPLMSLLSCEVHPERLHSVMIRGACLDRVDQVIDDYDWYYPDDSIYGIDGPADKLLTWMLHCLGLTRQAVTEKPYWLPYWETMLGHLKDKMGENSQFPEQPELGLQAFATRLAECKNSIMDREDTELTEEEMIAQTQVLGWMDRLWPGRVFFSTQGGRIGYADQGVKRGDMICIFYGMPRLSVLRPRRLPRYPGGDEVEFMSTAYVHGLNSGEGCSLPAATESRMFEIT